MISVHGAAADEVAHAVRLFAEWPSATRLRFFHQVFHELYHLQLQQQQLLAAFASTLHIGDGQQPDVDMRIDRSAADRPPAEADPAVAQMLAVFLWRWTDDMRNAFMCAAEDIDQHAAYALIDALAQGRWLERR